MSKCCEYCGATGNDHDFRCPNYKLPFSAYKCELCEEGIYDGEKYIGKHLTAGGNKYVHYECAMQDPEWLMEFLGVDVETMKDCEY